MLVDRFAVEAWKAEHQNQRLLGEVGEGLKAKTYFHVFPRHHFKRERRKGEMTNEGIAKKLFKKLYFIEEHDIEILAEALRQKEVDTIERCAMVAEQIANNWHDDVKVEKPWEHLTVKGQLELVSEQIRILKPTDKEQPKK